MPPVSVYWYEGNDRPVQVPEALAGENLEGFNEFFIGTKGLMGTKGRGEHVSLLPKAKMEEFTLPPQVLERSPGHYEDWIQACKTGKTPCSDFHIAAPYTEWISAPSVGASRTKHSNGTAKPAIHQQRKRRTNSSSPRSAAAGNCPNSVEASRNLKRRLGRAPGEVAPASRQTEARAVG